MYVRKLTLVLLVLAVSLSFYACTNDDSTNPMSGNQLVRAINDQYIIVYKGKSTNSTQSYDAKANAVSLLESNGISSEAIICVYTHVLNGFAAKLTLAEAELLMNDSRVDHVNPDKIFKIPDYTVVTDEKYSNDNIQKQTTPWGITAVKGPGTTSTKVAWILDTGVDLDHPDLTVDVSRSKTFVKLGKDALNADDNHGHGSHVAGTIAAKDNKVGAIGVSPGATVVAIKVLNLQGWGYTTDIIEGLDYIYTNGTSGDVINISLGGDIDTDLDDAVKDCAGKGIFVAIAAGNETQDASNCSPARVDAANVYTLSAYDSKGVFAYFSNFGLPVDYSAPGVKIYSCYKSGRYSTMSGTSMAAPHMAGILLVKGTGFSTNGTVKNDPDTPDDPIVVLQ